MERVNFIRRNRNDLNDKPTKQELLALRWDTHIYITQKFYQRIKHILEQYRDSKYLIRLASQQSRAIHWLLVSSFRVCFGGVVYGIIKAVSLRGKH